MSKTLATLAADLLSDSFRERFVQLFEVASRRSVCRWQEVGVAQAQLWLVDAFSAIPAGVRPLCVICVGPTFAEQAPSTHWSTRLEAGYTVADLIDVLDRAGVFLMDWHAQQSARALRAAPAAQPPGQGLQRWHLTAWVSLRAPHDRGAHLRALALMSREAVTVEQICRHAELDEASVLALLAELRQRGAVRLEGGWATRATPAPASPVVAGLVQRLALWLRGGGRAW